MERKANSGIKKRKAENQDNERLHKRLSLLNLEHNGRKLYVPVETPSSSAAPPPTSLNPTVQDQPDDIMRLDDTAHKVYIYDLDAELSDSESSDDGKLVFLPDIEKHLRETRIPPSVLANSEGELAGCNQLVLYNVPTSLSVPKEQDSVRKAIIETRARARESQMQNREREIETRLPQTPNNGFLSEGFQAQAWNNRVANGMPAPMAQKIDATKIASLSALPNIHETPQDDSDAMDID